jgi:hypothetical protein
MDYQFLQFKIPGNNPSKIEVSFNTSELSYGHMPKVRNLTGPFMYHFNKLRSEYGYPNIYYGCKDTLIIDVGLFINCKVNIINPTGDYLTVSIYDRDGKILRKIEKPFKCIIIRL